MRTRLPATIERSGGASTTPRAVIAPEVDRAGVAGHVTGDHPQPVGAVGRGRAALARSWRPADRERPGPALDAHGAHEARALPHLQCEARQLLVAAHHDDHAIAVGVAVGRDHAARDVRALHAHGRVEGERVEQLDVAAREAHLQPVGAVGRDLPAGLAPVPDRQDAAARVGQAAELAHDLPARCDDLGRHRPRGVHAEAHLRARHARRGAVRGEERAVVAVEQSAAVIRRRIDANGLDRRALELEQLGERERASRGGEQSTRECDRDCALHRAGSYAQERRCQCRSRFGCDDACPCSRPR